MDTENHKDQSNVTCKEQNKHAIDATTTAHRRQPHRNKKSVGAADSNTVVDSRATDDSRVDNDSNSTSDSCAAVEIKNHKKNGENLAKLSDDEDSQDGIDLDRKFEADTLKDILLHPFEGRTWDRLVRLLCRPTDPALLALCRFLFGEWTQICLVQESL